MRTTRRKMSAATVAALAVMLTATTATPAQAARAVPSVPSSAMCPRNAPDPVRNNTARFKASDTWVFGDSIMARCTWAMVSARLNAGGRKGAFYAKSGMYSHQAIDYAVALKRATGKQPKVIVWALGTNDTKQGRGVSQELNRLRRTYPSARIVHVLTYRGGKHRPLSAYTNRLTTSRALGGITYVDWPKWASGHQHLLKSDLVHPKAIGTPTQQRLPRYNAFKAYANLLPL